MSNNNKCKDCTFWVASPTANAGECRRFPPDSSRYDGKTRQGVYVKTGAEDWCGEFKEAEKPSPQPNSIGFHTPTPPDASNTPPEPSEKIKKKK